MANIAEGFTRSSNRELIRFLYIAMASASEVKSHLYVALDQGYINKESFEKTYRQATKTNDAMTQRLNDATTQLTQPTNRQTLSSSSASSSY